MVSARIVQSSPSLTSSNCSAAARAQRRAARRRQPPRLAASAFQPLHPRGDGSPVHHHRGLGSSRSADARGARGPRRASPPLRHGRARGKRPPPRRARTPAQRRVLEREELEIFPCLLRATEPREHARAERTPVEAIRGPREKVEVAGKRAASSSSLSLGECLAERCASRASAAAFASSTRARSRPPRRRAPPPRRTSRPSWHASRASPARASGMRAIDGARELVVLLDGLSALAGSPSSRRSKTSRMRPRSTAKRRRCATRSRRLGVERHAPTRVVEEKHRRRPRDEHLSRVGSSATRRAIAIDSDA